MTTTNTKELLLSVRNIYVYGPAACGDCKAVIRELETRGIAATKVTLDDGNPEHVAIREAARQRGDLAAPLVYADDEFVFAGCNIGMAIKLAREEHQLLLERGLVERPSNSLLLSR